MQQNFSLTIATFLALFILVAHALPTTNTHLNKRGDELLGGLGDLVDDGVIGDLLDGIN